MPTYVYHCSGCDANFEQFQKFSDDPIETCPSCGGSVRRVIHPAGIVFKGSGWYINDSRGANSTAKPSATPAAESAPAASEASAAPATPAPAAPAAPATAAE